MLSQEVKNLLENGSFQVNNQPQQFEGGELKETHISYLLLSKDYAFKIKKPVKNGFLDFVELSKRKYFCEKELDLNQRTASEMYMQVLPVRKSGNKFSIGSNEGELVDYALMMKRMDNQKEMDVLLENKKVNISQIFSLAKKIAAFHKRCYVIPKCPNINVLEKDFDEIREQQAFIRKTLGNPYGDVIEDAIGYCHQFLEDNLPLLKKRYSQGWVVDGHGDLHSRNIFLYDDPVIFDCIEFNDEFRQVDVLDEIAFFCMDLESFGANDLSTAFYRKYNELIDRENLNKKESKALFNYYKCYRANVRAKVTAMYMQEHPDFDEKKLNELKRYLDLMAGYCKNQYKSQLPFK